MQQEERYIKGRPIVTIFHNEQNLYTVLRIRVDESNEAGVNKDAVVTGYFPVCMKRKHIFLRKVYGSSKIWSTISS